MGEVVMISEDGLELQVQETRVGREMAKLGGGSGGSAAAAEGGSAVVRWDKFLPKMAVRVLLVEADDSTRQIISALLRKCCYKVAAVGDGLKAWELLKGRPNSIDLILTEAELPSISGFALLSLIMEHQACKNIPVIMMSWQDSISTVYKCMLRGATDFLVKPVRKNELRNLWQHVWRKQVSSIAAGLGPPDESVVQEKDDASNRSSGYMSCMDGRKEGGEKGSDAQSSCTKPESDTDEEQGVEYVRGPSKPGSGECISDGISTPGQEECRPLNNATGGSQEMTTLDAVILEDTRDDNEEENSLREAIDLIGAFDNHLKEGTIGTPPAIFSSKFDSLPMLDLSLRRYQADERPGLNHSDASAFSRYINKPLQPSSSTSPSPRNQYSNSEKQPLSCSQNKNLSHPTPLRGIGFGNLDGPYGFVMPSTYCEKSGSPPLPSPDTTHPSESFQPSNLLSSHQSHSHVDNTKSNSDDQLENKPDGKTEEMEDQGLVSPTNQTDSHRAMQREAALTKFRLKRKDRCFEKKVRYESRKKLAEQRPRMKGQFVRQVPSHPQHG